MKFFRHLHTINKHRFAVFKLCCKVGIPFRGLVHDLSKYSFEEFFESVKYYTDGNYSPIIDAKKDKGYSRAWLHHKGRNKHHFEYWTDYNPKTKKVEPVEMPYRYVAEMFCDRVAASKIYNGDSYKDTDGIEYFLRGKARRVIHSKT